MNRVIPAILEKEWAEIEAKFEIVKKFSSMVHVDFIDGTFCPNKTFFDFSSFSKYKELNLEAHLMTDNPVEYLKPLANAGFRRFIGHVEGISDVSEFIAQGQILGEVGLAIDLPTSIESLNINLEDLDFVLIMSVKAGESGQKFQTLALDKIMNLRKKTILPIEVDGGINEATIVQAKIAGADRFAVNNSLFNSINSLEAFEKLTSLLI